MTESKPAGCCCCGSSTGRRGFVAQAIALLVAAGAYAVPFFAGLVAFLNPLRQKAAGGQFLRLASLDTLPDGAPIRVPVIMDRSDAWNRYPNQPVGAVYLRRTGQEVQALQVVCPHAGCYIDFDTAAGQFYCPCHKATFNLEGKRREERSESPRNMDSLEVKVESGDVLVQFQNFQPGNTAKVPTA